MRREAEKGFGDDVPEWVWTIAQRFLPKRKRASRPFLNVQIQYVMPAGIDDQRLATLSFALEVVPVALVDVPVRHDARAVFVNQP